MKHDDGKLKYIGGIPYLTSQEIKIKQRHWLVERFGRLAAQVFRGWSGMVFLVVLLIGAVTLGATAIDLLLQALHD